MTLSFVIALALVSGVTVGVTGIFELPDTVEKLFANFDSTTVSGIFNLGSIDDSGSGSGSLSGDSLELFSSFAIGSSDDEQVATGTQEAVSAPLPAPSQTVSPSEPQSKAYFPAFSISEAARNPKIYEPATVPTTPSTAVPLPLPLPTFTGKTYPYLYAQQSGYLSAHNAYRRQHCVSDLLPNGVLTQHAADHAKKCNWGHNSTDLRAKVEGENLYASTFNVWYPPKSAAEAVGRLYDELYSPGYDFSNPGYYQNPGAGHFTQIVWASTAEVGCSVYICPAVLNGVRVTPFGSYDGDWQYVACRYNPPGNYLGQFPQNVLPPC